MESNKNERKKIAITPYSVSDVHMFEEILSMLYSQAAKNTDFAREEMKKMMKLFEREFKG
jgi:hypothetical protein